MIERHIPISAGKRITLSVATYQGVTRLDIRFQFLNGEDGWQPTQRGVVLPIDELDNVIGALSDLRDSLKTKETKC